MSKSIDVYDSNIYQRFTEKQNIDKALHTLEGILKGISIDNTITEIESNVVKDWINNNINLMQKPPLNELVYILEGVCKYNKLNNDDKESILYICQNFHENNNFYNDNTSDIQILHGILHGILADNHITLDELTHLQDWLSAHDNLEGTYPYDEINTIIYSILKNNHISNDEEALLQAYFSQFVDLDIDIDEDLKKSLNTKGICMLNPKIHLKNSLFCFTGKSSRCQRKEIAELIEKNGGLFNDRVVNDTNYLIVGNEGNPDWAYACYGRKIERAIKLRKEGHPIKIINELDFWKLFDDTTKNDTNITIDTTNLKFWNLNSLLIHGKLSQMDKQSHLSSLKITNLNKANFSADIIDEDDISYHTTLNDCSCFEFINEHVPCRHMYALAAKLKIFKGQKERRSKNLIVDCSSKYSKDWFFVIQQANYPALDILLMPRKENKKTIMALTQGKLYNFHDGSIFYDTEKAYTLPWHEALKEINYSIQITETKPSVNVNNFKYVDNCIIRHSYIHYGDLTFKLYKVNVAKTAEECIGTYTCKQDEFVKFLKTGILNKCLDLSKHIV